MVGTEISKTEFKLALVLLEIFVIVFLERLEIFIFEKYGGIFNQLLFEVVTDLIIIEYLGQYLAKEKGDLGVFHFHTSHLIFVLDRLNYSVFVFGHFFINTVVLF